MRKQESQQNVNLVFAGRARLFFAEQQGGGLLHPPEPSLHLQRLRGEQKPGEHLHAERHGSSGGTADASGIGDVPQFS